jgi:hypothetical protein
MKLEHYDDYKAEDTARSESALLTAWAILREFQDDLVLLGGLVPRYLCTTKDEDMQPVTMDVDLGVSLGMSSGIYETTKTRLENAGFDWEDQRFVKKIQGGNLFLDLLTDRPTADDPGTTMVDDIPVSAVFGVSRALEVFREVSVSGKDLYGANVAERIRVCEAGPYICLKLLAYGNRAKSKDVFDLVRCVKDYDGGPSEAARLFHAERGVNQAFDLGWEVLNERFVDASAKGPRQYVDFCFGGLVSSSADLEFQRDQAANEALDVARLLMNC